MNNQKLTLFRLQKQQAQLKKQPIPNVIVKREGVLHFHFCIYGLQDVYEGGYYHGVLELHNDYPFAPPTLKFFTPSGRFTIDTPICTTFTNFHKQSWTSAWNIRTMILATISFMTSHETGLGSINQSYAQKRYHAINSMKHNLKNDKFCRLFQSSLSEAVISKALFRQGSQQGVKKELVNKKSEKLVFFMYILLAIVILVGLISKL